MQLARPSADQRMADPPPTARLGGLALVRLVGATLAAIALILFVGILSEPVQALANDNAVWQPLIERWYGVGLVGIVAFLFLFPDGRLVPRGAGLALGLLAAWMLVAALVPAWLPWRKPLTAELAQVGPWLAAGVLAQVYHDGLGPTLAAQALKAGAARHLVRASPDLAEQVLGGLEADHSAALAEVRRLVYDLRPPALDELGLAGALRAAAAQFAAPGGATPTITVSIPGQLPSLPAAVEVAAYRIAYEALSNAVRHSGARTIHVTLACGDALCLTVSDDRHGIAVDATPGVGLRSMHERAAELGGTCAPGRSDSGGTQIQVYLPTQWKEAP
ncbi:MAG: hypothetical protein HGA45_37155 [Chloroflexales bacterium]|nr:hypothetical protein [Chloroflexales bacterium]